MTPALHPYSAYKPSGIEWLGDLPSHWEVARLSSLSQPKSTSNKQHRELLSVYLDLGKV